MPLQKVENAGRGLWPLEEMLKPKTQPPGEQPTLTLESDQVMAAPCWIAAEWLMFWRPEAIVERSKTRAVGVCMLVLWKGVCSGVF